jgi:hypothetical protein
MSSAIALKNYNGRDSTNGSMMKGKNVSMVIHLNLCRCSMILTEYHSLPIKPHNSLIPGSGRMAEVNEGLNSDMLKTNFLLQI